MLTNPRDAFRSQSVYFTNCRSKFHVHVCVIFTLLLYIHICPMALNYMPTPITPIWIN